MRDALLSYFQVKKRARREAKMAVRKALVVGIDDFQAAHLTDAATIQKL